MAPTVGHAPTRPQGFPPPVFPGRAEAVATKPTMMIMTDFILAGD